MRIEEEHLHPAERMIPDALAFLDITTQHRVLPTNLVQFNRLHSGMAFDGEQGIRSLNCSVLPGIVGHETASISRNYTKIDDTAKRAAVNKLPDITK
jgi:hypothetical protein